MNGVLVGDASLANTKAEIARKWRSSSRPVDVELDLERRGDAGSQGERRLAEPDGPPGAVTCADGDDLLALENLVGGEEDRPGAAQTIRANTAQR